MYASSRISYVKISIKKAAKSCGRYVVAAIRHAGAESQAFALYFLAPIAGLHIAENGEFKIVGQSLVMPSAHRPVGPFAILGEPPLEIDIAFLGPARILQDQSQADRKDDDETGAGNRADDRRNNDQYEADDRKQESGAGSIFPTFFF